MRLSNKKRVSKRYASRTYTELAYLTRVRINGIGLWSNFKNLPHADWVESASTGNGCKCLFVNLQ